MYRHMHSKLWYIRLDAASCEIWLLKIRSP